MDGGRSGRYDERRSRQVYKMQPIAFSLHQHSSLLKKQKSSITQTARMSTLNSENASTLESAMQLMIQTFHKYSGNEGDKYTLSKAELKEMLTQELGNYLGNAQDKDAVEKVMGDLDSNNDGEVDFTEFIILVGALTVACNDFFLEYHEKDGKKENNKE